MTKKNRKVKSKNNNNRQLGTTRSTRFLQYLGRQIITAAASVSTSTSYTIATLASDLSSSRLVLLRSVTVKFYPTAISTLAGGTIISRVSAQLLMVDPATQVAVPITPIKPLSSTNYVSLTGRAPFVNWLSAGSSNIGLIVLLYNIDGAISVPLDIQSTFMLAQDLLT